MVKSWNRPIVTIAFCFPLLAAFNVFAAPGIDGRPEPFVVKPGMHISKRLTANALFQTPLAPSSYPATVRALFLRVDFIKNTDPKATGSGVWTDPLYAYCVPVPNTTTCNADPDYWITKNKERMIAYYKEVSKGLLTLNITITPVYHLLNTMSSYGADTSATIQSLVQDGVNAAKAGGLSFSTVVNGIPTPNFDAVFIVHAGPGEETAPSGLLTNEIWSLYSPLTPINVDGVKITEAIIMPQTGSHPMPDGTMRVVDPLGVYAHELGHWLGLPDLYDTSQPPTWDGIGRWGLMASGLYNRTSINDFSGSSPAHLDAWCKAYLGWITPLTQAPAPDPGTKTIRSYSDPLFDNKADILKLQAGAGASAQYYLLEYRQKTGFDAGLPGAGLLVWLVDDDVLKKNIGANTVNTNPQRPGLALIEADGNDELKKYQYTGGSDGDPFPGSANKTSLTPYTTPASTPYTGFPWLYLNNIYISGSNATMTIGFAPNPPSNLTASRNSTTVLNWTANTEPDLAKYKVYKNGVALAETTQNQYTDTASNNGDVYSVTAVDINGFESVKSASVTVSFAAGNGSGGSGKAGVGGCFIATAAYGSYLDPHVMVLRDFRDKYLLTNPLGREFVSFYYNVSPPIAAFISEHEGLRFAARLTLTPVVYGVKYPWASGILPIIIGGMIRKRRGRK